MILSGIVAMSNDQAIGLNGQMPWHCPEDLKLFKKLTTSHAIIMGRKTFESIGKPLPNRLNIVISRNPTLKLPLGCLPLHSPGELFSVDFTAKIKAFSTDHQIPISFDKIFIIGGAEIYRLFLPHLTELLISRIPGNFEADTWFPEFENTFCLQNKLPYATFEFQTYRRVGV